MTESNPIQPLNPLKHKDNGWKYSKSAIHAQHDHYVPIDISELSMIVVMMPIAFLPTADGAFQLIGVQSIVEEENVFIALDGTRIHSYTPHHYASYPFSMRKAEVEGNTHHILCFDHDSGLFRESPDEKSNEIRFFSPNGEMHPGLSRMCKFMAQASAARDATRVAVAALQELELLQAWDLSLPELATEKKNFSGFYKIDREKLSNCSGAQLKVLSDAKALELAYAHFLSRKRMATIIQLHKKKYRGDTDLQRPGRAKQKLSLDFLSQSEDDNSITFDFD